MTYIKHKGLFIKESFENSKITLIVSRYNENLEWLKEEPFNKYNVILYNKGVNDNYYKSPKIINTYKIENIGKCDHTYLYHIIQNYDNMSEINVFLPGSVNMSYKINRAKKLLNEIEKNDSSVFLYNESHNNIQQQLYNFQIENYVTSSTQNQKINDESILELSKLRPFGKWYEKYFNNITTTHISYQGIFSVSNKDIMKNPKSYYENLIKELSNSSNPEVGHYFERSWEAVFYPLNTLFIEGFE